MAGFRNVFDGPALRAAREAQVDPATGRPWSQAVLAFKLREAGAPISVQQIGKWERELEDPERVEPQARYLAALSQVFDRSMDSFFRKLPL